MANRQEIEPVPAPLETVAVTFTLNGDESHHFQFNPSPLNLPNTGGTITTLYTVTFNLTSNIPDATLVSENTVTGGDGRTIETSGSGTSQLTIRFDNAGLHAPDSLGYTMTVRANGRSFTSPDPEIIIPPPG